MQKIALSDANHFVYCTHPKYLDKEAYMIRGPYCLPSSHFVDP